MKDSLNPTRLLSILFILAIAVVFTLQFGPGGTGFGTTTGPGAASAASNAAVVNGKEIPLPEFQREYAQQMQQFRSMGQNIPDSLARQLGLPQQVLERLVNRELLAQAAQQRGIVPSNDELLELIHANPDFQKDGQFDFTTYNDVLRDYYRKTAPQFEDDLRHRLAAQKMVELVENGAVVSEDEVRARFEKEGNQAKIVFARFLPSMYVAKVPAPTPAQLTEFQKAHTKEISDYFEANKFAYRTPEQVKARRIVVRVAPAADAAQKAALSARAQAVHKDAESGKDFAELAKQSSDDADTKALGGDMGWVARNKMDPKLAETVFATEPGKIAGPVETADGFYVVKVEEKRPATEKTLTEVEGEIALTLWNRDHAKELARADADKALATIKSGKALKDLYPAEKEGQPALLRFETETRPEAVETDSFTASGDSVPHLGPAPALVNATFAAKNAQVLDQVFPVGDGYVLAQVTERKQPSQEEFAKQKDDLRTQARQAKQIELRESFVKALKKQGTVVTNAEVISTVGEGS